MKRLPEVVLTLTGEVKILIGKKAVNAIKVTSVDAELNNLIKACLPEGKETRLLK